MAWTERYVDPAGDNSDGTTWATAWSSLASMIAAAPSAGTRVNIKANTYAQTTNNRAFPVGDVSTPIWYRGCDGSGNAITADLSGTAGTDYPLITTTTGALSVTGTGTVFSGIKFTSSGAVTLATATGAAIFDNCILESTWANTGGYALSGGSTLRATRCLFVATTTANRTVNATVAVVLFRCTVSSGKVGVYGGNNITCVSCTFLNQVTYAIESTNTVGHYLFACTFYNPGTDAVRFTSFFPANTMIADCLFSTCGGYAIRNAAGTSSDAAIVLYRNLYYDCTSGALSGIDADVYDILSVTASGGTAPMVNPGAGDYTPQSGGGAFQVSMTLPGTTQITYPDLGAVIHQDPAGGSGGRPEIRGANL